MHSVIYNFCEVTFLCKFCTDHHIQIIFVQYCFYLLVFLFKDVTLKSSEEQVVMTQVCFSTFISIWKFFLSFFLFYLLWNQFPFYSATLCDDKVESFRTWQFSHLCWHSCFLWGNFFLRWFFVMLLQVSNQHWIVYNFFILKRNEWRNWKCTG